MTETLFQTTACPLCQADDYIVLKPAKYPQNITKENLQSMYRSASDHHLMDQLVQCHSCKMVYLNPRVNMMIIHDGYSQAMDPVFIKQNPNRINTFTQSLQLLIKKLKLHSSKSYKILDIGCAGGAFPKAATDLGFSVIGIEPSQWMCDFAKKEYGLDVRQGLLEEQSFKDQSFNMISLWDVLEHTHDPIQILTHCHRLLKPGGYLVMTVPDYGSFAAKLLGNKWPFLLSVHLLYFDRKSLTQLCQKTNFKLLHMRPHWQTLQLGYVFERAGAYFKVFTYLASFLKLLHLDTIPFKYTVGQSLIIAQKQ